MRVWQYVALVMMVALLPLQANAKTEDHATTIGRGFAAHYRPGKMEAVRKNRRMPRKTACMIASPFYKIGTTVYVKSQVSAGGKKIRTTLKCTVMDVPQPKDRQRIINRGIVVELDFTSAKILCGIQRVNQEPPRACPVIYWRA